MNFHPVNHMGYIYNTGYWTPDSSDMCSVHTSTPIETRSKNCIIEYTVAKKKTCKICFRLGEKANERKRGQEIRLGS